MLTINPLRRARTTNSTSTGFTAKIPTTTEPITSLTGGVNDLLDPTLSLHLGQAASRFLEILPFGTAANNNTFDMRVWGWSKTIDATPLYIPKLLLQLNIVLGNVDGSAIASNTFFADQITIAYGDTNAPVISTANDTPASIIVHTRGSRYIEFDWDLAGISEGTNMNAYWHVFDQS